MKMKSLTLKTLLLGVLMTLPLMGSAAEGSIWDWLSFDRLKGVSPVVNAEYEEECGACHFAYQPGLLPSRSWRELFTAEALADHFGENAELDEELRQQLEKYAIEHAADDSIYKRSRKNIASLTQEVTPLRITEVRYIRRKHAEIPKQLISWNPQVKTLINCDACHTKAAEGIFDDDTVFIKGHGPWDD